MSAPRRGTPARNKSRRPAVAPDPVNETWTFTAEAVDDTPSRTLIRPAADPTALIRSLGPPPLPGGETAAEHYFAVVYERAAALAVALAAASDLLDPDALHGDDDIVLDH